MIQGKCIISTAFNNISEAFSEPPGLLTQYYYSCNRVFKSKLFNMNKPNDKCSSRSMIPLCKIIIKSLLLFQSKKDWVSTIFGVVLHHLLFSPHVLKVFSEFLKEKFVECTFNYSILKQLFGPNWINMFDCWGPTLP